jgi:hypothetical protein
MAQQDKEIFEATEELQLIETGTKSTAEHHPWSPPQQTRSILSKEDFFFPSRHRPPFPISRHNGSAPRGCRRAL